MLGDLSAIYESSGDCGCISSGWGDPGGKSYGLYQFSSNAGSLQQYVSWLQNNNWWFGNELAQHELTSDSFDAAWKWLAETNTDDFARSQFEYTKAAYYDPAIQILADNYYNVESNHAEVMRDVVWSRSVQYGVGNILEMFMDAATSLGYPNLSYVDADQFDADMIRAIYLNVCSSWEWNSTSLRDSLNNRFLDECNRALARL